MHDDTMNSVPHPVACFVMEDLVIGFAADNLVVVHRKKFLSLGVFEIASRRERDCFIKGTLLTAVGLWSHVQALVSFPSTDQAAQRSQVHLRTATVLCHTGNTSVEIDCNACAATTTNHYVSRVSGGPRQ